MKDFFKYMAATVAGLIVFCVITGVIGVMSIVGMIASESAAKDVKDNTVMTLKLTGMLQERAEDSFMDQLTGGSAAGTIGLDDMLSAIKKAKNNNKIKGIYIEAGMFTADSYASLQALRNALVDFKKNGKWIIAYADTYTQGTYYVSSVADEVLLNPSGQLDWHGLASQPIFLKDLLSKFGVKVQLAKVGRYKSMPEMYTADKMSDANREQVSRYIGGIWNELCQSVSKSRKVSVKQLNEYADSMITLSAPADYVKYKLVDKLVYTDGVKAEINKRLGQKADDDVATVGVSTMKTVKGDKNKGDEIAVYYAYGSIVDNAAQGLMGGSHNIVSKDVCDDLKALADDDDVKAVVMRINSGGGSAYASEQIWHYVELLKKKKPVVVSMGGAAASGGYYISSGANWIVAEPTTLTGSIGIFGMFPDFSGLLTQKLGVKFDEVKTNRNSAFGTMARPFNEEELSYLNKYIERGYDLFRSRVAQGRSMSIEQVEKIAQGHVFTGQDALGIKLVDELGGLDVAVAKAAKLAKLSEYHTDSYPAKADWMEQLLSSVSGGSYLDNAMRTTFGEYYDPFLLLKTLNRQNAIQARVPFMLNVE